jgi:hypothetical protein
MDWWPEALLARGSWLIRFERCGVACFANAGWPAAIGMVTGLSAKGFAVVLNAVSGSEGTDFAGYPVLLFVRRVVEDAGGFGEALEMLTKARLAAPALLTLAGTDNDQRVVIERSPRHHALRWGEPGRPLIATNDYRALSADAASGGDLLAGTACGRYEVLEERFAAHAAGEDVEDEVLLTALSDARVIQEITAQQVLIRPRAGSIRLFVPRRLLEGE